MKKLLHVDGMMCQNCAKHVREALEKIQGVSDVSVDLGAKTVSLTASGDVSDSVLSGAVDKAGYELKGIDTL